MVCRVSSALTYCDITHIFLDFLNLAIPQNQMPTKKVFPIPNLLLHVHKNNILHSALEGNSQCRADATCDTSRRLRTLQFIVR